MNPREIWKRIDHPYPSWMTTDTWKQFENNFKNSMLPHVPADFLRKSECINIFASQGSTWVPAKLAHLERFYSMEPFLKELLKDPPFGTPFITNQVYQSSDSTVMQAYHATRYMEVTGKTFSGDVLFELGGGYGNLCRMFHKMYQTWVILDVPIMTFLQYHYLSSFFEPVLCTGDVAPKVGRVNLIPLSFYGHTAGIKADMFVSNFALNECPEAMGEMLKGVNWYDAENFMLAFWGHKNIDILKEARTGWHEEPIGDGCPANYLFR